MRSQCRHPVPIKTRFRHCMKSIRLTAILLAAIAVSMPLSAAADPLESGFANPPDQTRPWCYWYWISDNISKEGITKDLEAMNRIGIGEALIGNIFLDDQPAGAIKVLSEEWWQLVEHAIREGGRIGVNIGMFNCPGWSQSGGPWIKPEQSMRYVASSEIRVTGPRRFAEKIAAPKVPFQDIATLAFPAPQHDAASMAMKPPRITITPSVPEPELLADGKLETGVLFNLIGGAEVTMDIRFETELTARSLRIYPNSKAFGAEAELQVADQGGGFKPVRKFKCDRSNPAVGTGFMPQGPVTISFPATTGSHFRIVFSRFFGPEKIPGLAEIDLSGAARLESYIEKQLAKMHPTPLPLADT